MSIEPAFRPVPTAAGPAIPSHVPASDGGVPAAHDDALDFVRFCYRRRRIGWPEIYDEMSAVAARGLYQGLGYADLAERGISFCLSDMPRLVALTERVIAEERTTHEPATKPSAIKLTAVPARS